MAALNAEPERAAHLQRVGDTEIVGPSLGEVLPWMGARVGRNEALLPVRGRGLAIVPLQSGPIVLPVVAERFTKGIAPAAVTDGNGQ